MKIAIKHPKRDILLTVKLFDNIELAKAEVVRIKKYWQKQLKNNPELPKTRLNLWKKAKFETVGIEDRFSVGGAYVEQIRGLFPSHHKKIEKIEQKALQNSVNRVLNKTKRIR